MSEYFYHPTRNDLRPVDRDESRHRIPRRAGPGGHRFNTTIYLSKYTKSTTIFRPK